MSEEPKPVYCYCCDLFIIINNNEDYYCLLIDLKFQLAVGDATIATLFQRDHVRGDCLRCNWSRPSTRAS